MITAEHNPFATARVEALLPYDPEWAGMSWEQLDSRFARLGRRAAIVGPHGSGKTTFLETFADRLRAGGESVAPLFMNRGSREAPPEFFNTVDERTTILFDGAEGLGPVAWRRFLRRTRRARGLLITGHRPGRLPTLFETRVSPAVLHRCIKVLDPGFEAAVDTLFHRHRGNIRHALLECYDLAGRAALG